MRPATGAGEDLHTAVFTSPEAGSSQGSLHLSFVTLRKNGKVQKIVLIGVLLQKSRSCWHPWQKGWKELKTKPHSDTQTTVGSLREEVREFMEERNWDGYHSPKNLGMSIAIEAAEIMEHFQWYSTEESRELGKDEEPHTMVADEVADVIIYCLALANQLDFDVSTAVRRKLESGRRRYPIGYMPTP